MESRTLLRAWSASVLAFWLSAPLAAASIRIQGRVSAGKSGLSGARVELFSAHEGYAEAARRWQEKKEPVPIAKAVTKENGDFEIRVPESGCYRLTVQAEGYRAVPIALLPLVEDVELPSIPLMRDFPPEARTAGPESRPLAAIEARGGDGKPVPGTLARWNGRTVGITGADGRLEIAIPEGDSALILESREGWGARIAQIGGKGILPVRLEPPRRIAGRVVDAVSRKPVAGALVWSGSPLVAPPVRSGADGGFVLQIPAAEEPWLEAGAAGFLPGERQLAKPGAEPAVLALSPSVALSGVVVDARDQPVAGVTITLGYVQGSRNVQAMARSRADGGFRFPQLPPGGTFGLTAVRSGFVRTRATARTAPAGQASPPVRIVMSDGQTAFGLVVGEGDRPVPGAEVTLLPERQARLDAVSDAEGRFEFRHLDPGRISVKATHPDHAPAFLNGFEIPSGQPAVDLGTLRLPPGEFIEGRVTDHRGTPVEGAAVRVDPEKIDVDWLIMSTSEIPQEGPQPLRTAADGTFRAGNLEGGQRFELRVEREGYVTASLSGVPAPTQEPLQIELETARNLSGRVIGPEGEPVPGASLNSLRKHEAGVFSQPLGTSDAKGRFRLTGFPPGTLSLAVTAEGYAERRIEGIPVPRDKDPEDLQVTLQRAILLEVRVLNARGEPVPGAMLAGRSMEPGRDFFLTCQSPTDGAGRCRLAVPEPGSYQVTASKPDRPSARARIEVPSGSSSVEVRFPPGTEISGRVVDEKGAVPAGAFLRLRQGHGPQQHVGIGTDGTFAFSEIPDGEYRLAAFQGEMSSEEIGVTVAGQPIRGIELRVEPKRQGTTLTGHVLGLSAEELRELEVVVRVFHPGDIPLGAVRVDREGAYRFEKLAPGEWRVHAYTFGENRSVESPLEIPPGVSALELDLKLPPALTLTGRVLVDGAPLGEAQVKAHGPRAWISQGVRTAYDGTFKLRNVPPGPTTLVVTGSQGLSGVRTLTLTESQDVQIELAMGRLAGTVISATGEPVEDALVRLEGWLPNLQISYAESVVRTGPDGTFEAPRLGAGTYKVKVSKEGVAPAEITAEVPAGGSAPPVQVLMKSQEGGAP